ncbi:hypothetical protein AB1L42_05840 [Thalassoglobus sp. JC818]|uniref:hypothetical protein n=1 Tax=Thalassoglobus sp. JC818 TaxID=3232136 RepID=UPI003459A9D2
MSRFLFGLACTALCMSAMSMSASEAYAGGGFFSAYGFNGGGCYSTYQSYSSVDYAPYSYNYNPVNYAFAPYAGGCNTAPISSGPCDTCTPAPTCSSHCTSYCPGTFGKHHKGCGYRNGCGYGHGCGLLGPFCPFKRASYSDCGTCGSFGYSGGCCGW